MASRTLREEVAAATADTVYRAGSVSKPITALLLMMLVEQGAIDLDAPVHKYLPDFQPKNKTGKQITLAAKCIAPIAAGLVRESPVGNYFDATEPTLAQTVASLNKTLNWFSFRRATTSVTPMPPLPPSVCCSKKRERSLSPSSSSGSCWARSTA